MIILPDYHHSKKYYRVLLAKVLCIIKTFTMKLVEEVRPLWWNWKVKPHLKRLNCCQLSSFNVLLTFVVQLLSTADEVEKLQEELESMQPLLAQAAEETVETMEKIKVDSVWIVMYLIQ